MRRIRAVLYGVGAMNSYIAELLVERGVTIVGALARSPAKVGRDLGDVAGLGRPLGVRVDADPEELLARVSADIAVLSTTSTYETHEEQIAVCVRNGVNVITIAEELLYPWATNPAISARLDALARRHGVTITGGGHTDALWVGMPLLLTAPSRRIDALRGVAALDLNHRSRDAFDALGLGRDPSDAEDLHRVPDDAHLRASAERNALDAIAAELSLTVTDVIITRWPLVAQWEIDVVDSTGTPWGSVRPGQVSGTARRVEMRTAQGPELSLEFRMEVGDMSREEWVITGDPELRLSTSATGPATATCMQTVHRIPDVIDAPPGLVTVAELPPLRYRPRQLHEYLRRPLV